MLDNALLLLTSRNIQDSTGERRLIMNRSEALWREFGIRTYMLSAVRSSRLESAPSLTLPPGIDVECIPYNSVFDLRGALRLSQVRTRELLRDARFRTVVLSGAHLYPLMRNRDLFGDIPVLIDIHGSLEELLEYPARRGARKVLGRPLYNLAKAYENYAIAKSDGCLVVSDELAYYLNEQYGATSTFVIPCGVLDGMSIQYDLARSRWREHFGIASDEVVFVYSGGVSRWQCIEAAAALYRIMSRMLDCQTRLLVLTSKISEMRKLLDRELVLSEDLIMESLSPDFVPEALCAADVGFLLRECNITNSVAFPNKFAEYLVAGLVIATSPGLKHPARIVATHNLGVLLDPYHILTGDTDANEVRQLAKLIEQRNSNPEAYRQRSTIAASSHTNMSILVKSLGGLIIDNTSLRQ